jgi:hypothetical protein
MLLPGSGDELCGPLPALFQAAAHHLPTVGLLPSQPLFTEKLHGGQLLALPPFSSALSVFPPPLLCATFQFVVYYSGVFLQGGFSLPRGLCWFIPGVAGGILHDTWHSLLLSAKFLPSRFGAGIWQWQEPSCSVTWCGEAFHGLGVQGVEVLILLGALSPPSVAPASQQGF